MNTRSSPDVEPLEIRQLLSSSVAVGVIAASHPAAGESTETAVRRSLMIPNRESQEVAPPQKAQAGSGPSANRSAALWPAAPQIGDLPSAPPNEPSSASEPGQYAILFEAVKDNSSPVQAPRKLAELPGAASTDAGLGVPTAAAYSPIKQAGRLLPGRNSRGACEESFFHDEKRTALGLYQREQVPSPVRRSVSGAAVSQGEARQRRLFRGTQGRAASGELETVFSLLAADLSLASSSSRLIMEGGLDAKMVERLFCSTETGLLDSVLPGSEQTFLPRQAVLLPPNYAESLPELGSPPGGTIQPAKSQQPEGSNATSVLPWYLSVVLYRPSGKPLDPSAQQGLERLCAYAWYSIHNAERVHGEKFRSPEDVVQEIYLEWRGLVGPQAEDTALRRLLENGSEEMRFLRMAVQRVIGRARYQQKQWTKALALGQLAGSTSAFARRGEQERIDWEDLWQNIVSTLGPQEKQILEMRKEGKTYAEIGASLGMARQRVCETYHRVVSQLQKNYPDWVGYHS